MDTTDLTLVLTILMATGYAAFFIWIVAPEKAKIPVRRFFRRRLRDLSGLKVNLF